MRGILLCALSGFPTFYKFWQPSACVLHLVNAQLSEDSVGFAWPANFKSHALQGSFFQLHEPSMAHAWPMTNAVCDGWVCSEAA